MCLALVLIMYNFFYKTVEVDVMKNIELVYTGENGSASVTVETILKILIKGSRSLWKLWNMK